jgi:hypothetical protein
LLGFQMQGNFAPGLGEQRNHPLALAQGTELLGTANLRGVGAGCEQSQRDPAGVKGLLDFCCPRSATLETLGIEPGVETFSREGRLQPLR